MKDIAEKNEWKGWLLIHTDYKMKVKGKREKKLKAKPSYHRTFSTHQILIAFIVTQNGPLPAEL
jgi:hypothetical protein